MLSLKITFFLVCSFLNIFNTLKNHKSYCSKEDMYKKSNSMSSFRLMFLVWWGRGGEVGVEGNTNSILVNFHLLSILNIGKIAFLHFVESCNCTHIYGHM